MNRSWSRTSVAVQIFAAIWIAFVAAVMLYMVAAGVIGTRDLQGRFFAGCTFYLLMGVLIFWGGRNLGRPPVSETPSDEDTQSDERSPQA